MIKKKCYKNNWIKNKYQEMDIYPIDFRGSIKDEYAKELRDGIRRIKSHILGRWKLFSFKC
jgi:predicted nucleic acid-binding Zn finger protein